MHHSSRKPLYFATNESLLAIIDGLQPSSTDVVLAICGSGDQAFALAEFSTVIAIDSKDRQLAYAQERLLALRDGNSEAYYRPRLPAIHFKNKSEQLRFSEILKHITLRNEYFKTRNVDAIAGQSIDFIEGNILDYASFPHNRPFNKLYLSNALVPDVDARRLFSALPSGGLVYTANDTLFTSIGGKDMLQSHPLLTRAAKQHASPTGYHWNVAVYEKK